MKRVYPRRQGLRHDTHAKSFRPWIPNRQPPSLAVRTHLYPSRARRKRFDMRPIKDSVEYIVVGLPHVGIGLSGFFRRRIEGIKILHKKLFRSKKASPWTWLITKLAANLVYTNRQGLDTVNFSADQFRNLLFMGGCQDHLGTATILETEKLNESALRTSLPIASTRPVLCQSAEERSCGISKRDAPTYT